LTPRFSLSSRIAPGLRVLAQGGLVVRVLALVIAIAATVADGPALARDVATYVIPGKRGVPVIINGVDASYCLIESDWGLARPGHMTPTIIDCPPVVRGGVRGSRYYPEAGRRPGYGRHEIEPPADRRLPPPAPSFHREWSTQSDPLPASLDPPALVPFVAEPRRPWRRRPHAHLHRPQ
jgi:hypothetical protein